MAKRKKPPQPSSRSAPLVPAEAVVRVGWRARISRKKRFGKVNAALRPPPELTLSQWADRYFYLSAESAAAPGRWRTLPYQKGILDAITSSAVERVSVIKSARVGYTKCVNAAIGYFVHQDPCPIMVVQPTIEDAEGYSKEEIAPMIRDCEVLTPLIGAAPPRKGKRAKRGRARKESTSKTSAETILNKSFPGGILSMVGANSGRGFRRTSRRVVIFDEVDAYPPSAGSDGDPVKLGERRAEYYWNRKIIAGSTPLVSGSSRIEEMFLAGDQRRFYVPCPTCGHKDFLCFKRRADGADDGEAEGHVMHWPKNNPAAAHFICKHGCLIEETSKRSMLEKGEWRAKEEFKGHASFHIWAAYSLSPNATWAQIAIEFVEANAAGAEQLRTFVNTVLGETWKERGEAPDWERLHLRRSGKVGVVPDGPIVLTAGVDVQKDRFVYEVVGWARNRESWSIDSGELHGDTALDATWKQLDDLLARTYARADGQEFPIAKLGIDSGYNTQMVYSWARRYPMSRVIATKGQSGAKPLLGSPSPVEIKANGDKRRRGYKVWPIGVDIAKGELYGVLGLKLVAGEPTPAGYCHFPEYDEDYFQQLTAEHLVTSVNRKTRRQKLAWHVLPNRENHILDARIIARAAASALGIDRLANRPPTPTTPNPTPVQQPADAPPPPPQAEPAAAAPRSGYWEKRPRGAGWLGRRR